VTSEEFVVGLEAEMRALFARLGERETLEAESEGQVEVRTLLRLALKSELEAAELASHWLASTPELDAKLVFVQQCSDEMKHFGLILARLAALGDEAAGADPLAGGYSPLYHFQRGLRTTAERVAAGPFTSEAIAEVRNRQFIDFCRAQGDDETARLYEQVIQPEEIHHRQSGRDFLARHCTTPERQELAAAAVRATLAIAEELSTLAARTGGSVEPPLS
jgi:hypothetical protein